MAIFVNNPGNLSNPDTLAKIMIGIDKFEHAEYAIGPSSTLLWLNDYMFYTKLQVFAFIKIYNNNKLEPPTGRLRIQIYTRIFTKP